MDSHENVSRALKPLKPLLDVAAPIMRRLRSAESLSGNCSREKKLKVEKKRGGRQKMLREEIREHVILGHATETETGVQELLTAQVSVDEIIQQVLVPAMAVVGEKFRRNEIFVPEMLIAARAMQAGLAVLEPLILQTGRQYMGRVVIGTVKGDLHDIGKKLVATMLQGAGWEVIDLGVDVAPEKFLQAVKEHKPEVVGLSALLTTTMPNMKATIELLKEEGVRDQVHVMVGGAPVTEKFAKEVGADGFAADAGEAVEKCEAFVV